VVKLAPVHFSQVAGFAAAELLPAFQVFQNTARAFASHVPELRSALPVGPDLHAAFKASLEIETGDEAVARRFFQSCFVPHDVHPDSGQGFLTGYYEPEVQGSLTQTDRFTCPILARPDDLITFDQNASPLLEGYAAARRLQNGALAPYFSRSEIEAGFAQHHTRPVVFLEDPVEVFLIQVQGSARIVLPDGRRLRLKYAGRNGHPYTSIGKVIIAQNHIAAESMTLARLKSWLRGNDLRIGGLARSIMQLNSSYVFFEIQPEIEQSIGPVGGAGLPLTPLVSLAIDRSLWSYGLPFWLNAQLPFKRTASESFQRMMIAQDTGSAIIGPARGDVFFGSGDAAGTLAGNIRHDAAFTVFLPKPDA